MKGDTLIWDVDGTLYPLSPEFDARCIAAAGSAARQLGFPGSQEEAEALAIRGFLEQHNGLEVFTQSHPIAMTDLHRAYHEHIDISELPSYQRLRAFMNRTPHTHAALTHGSTDWARRILTQRGLLPYFDDAHIVGMEQYDFQTKSASEAPFRTMLDRLGKDAEQCIMVEDSHRNLRIPHAMGMTTVLVCRTLDDPPPYVSHQFRNPESLMQHLHRAQARMPSGRHL